MRVVLHFETEPVSLRVARKQIAAAAGALGASELDARRVELAAGEALTNAYRHAYGEAEGPVDVEILHDGDRFVIVVHDEGQGRPCEGGLAAPPDPKTGGGYGLRVIRELMDEAEISPRAEGRGTCVRMGLRLR